ncbi:MAG: YvgZ [Parcubacteria group bacterium GW2011_GWA2_47_16]|nr:MAG: YvgZ [Parcubacteria group bacterium GW2011_GWA2_47_16]
MENKSTKQKLLRRIKIVEGQVRGLHEMIERGEYCIDVITQTSAVKQALSGIEDVLMETHLSTCAVDQIRKGKGDKAREEILKVYRLKRK